MQNVCWLQKLLNIFLQIAAEAAEAAAKKVRNEMQEKLDLLEQVLPLTKQIEKLRFSYSVVVTSFEP